MAHIRTFSGIYVFRETSQILEILFILHIYVPWFSLNI
jgi:hypothetical protein